MIRPAEVSAVCVVAFVLTSTIELQAFIHIDTQPFAVGPKLEPWSATTLEWALQVNAAMMATSVVDYTLIKVNALLADSVKVWPLAYQGEKKHFKGRCLRYHCLLLSLNIQTSIQTSKTTFNNDQPRSGKKKDLLLETLFRDYSWDIETHCYEKPSKSAQIAIAQVVK